MHVKEPPLLKHSPSVVEEELQAKVRELEGRLAAEVDERDEKIGVLADELDAEKNKYLKIEEDKR